MICNNCKTLFEGKFCSNCGQKSSVGELKMHDLLHEFWHSVTHTDKGILKLIKDLFLHPSFRRVIARKKQISSIRNPSELI